MCHLLLERVSLFTYSLPCLVFLSAQGSVGLCLLAASVYMAGNNPAPTQLLSWSQIESQTKKLTRFVIKARFHTYRAGKSQISGIHVCVCVCVCVRVSRKSHAKVPPCRLASSSNTNTDGALATVRQSNANIGGSLFAVDNHDSSSDDISAKLKTAEEARDRAANLKGMQAKLKVEMAKIAAMADEEQKKYKNVVNDIAKQVGRNKVKKNSTRSSQTEIFADMSDSFSTKRMCGRRNGMEKRGEENDNAVLVLLQKRTKFARGCIRADSLILHM